MDLPQQPPAASDMEYNLPYENIKDMTVTIHAVQTATAAAYQTLSVGGITFIQGVTTLNPELVLPRHTSPLSLARPPIKIFL